MDLAPGQDVLAEIKELGAQLELLEYLLGV